ncbi:hypothetical protein TELCIR_20347, partial [Teladorsagia circumcincta]
DRILHSYDLIYEELTGNPVELKVEEAPVHMYDYDEVISKPRFFTPPLQYQRNAFVRDIIYAYMEEAGEKIRKPQLFIISTPNHEYNEAFGMPNGKFRHDDHKFEFTRQQFRNWLHEILSDFPNEYEYAVSYVGNVQAYAHLGGATQFGIIRRKRNGITTMLPHISTKSYKKVGEMVVKNSFFPLEREKIKQAFILWLEENPLLQEDLTKSFIGEFWRVCTTAVMNNIELPAQLKKDLNKKALV